MFGSFWYTNFWVPEPPPPPKKTPSGTGLLDPPPPRLHLFWLGSRFRKHGSRSSVCGTHTRPSSECISLLVSDTTLPLFAGECVQAGDFVTIQPKHVMTHDNTAAVMQKFVSLQPGIKVHNPQQPVFTLDHDIQNKSEANLKKYANIAAFAKEQGVDAYPAGRGIGHQVSALECSCLTRPCAPPSVCVRFVFLGASVLLLGGVYVYRFGLMSVPATEKSGMEWHETAAVGQKTSGHTVHR